MSLIASSKSLKGKKLPSIASSKSLIASSKSTKGKKLPSITLSKSLSSKSIELSIEAPKSSSKGKESIKAPKSHISYESEKLPPYQIDLLDSGATTCELLKYCKYPIDLPIFQEDQLTALMGKFTLSESRPPWLLQVVQLVVPLLPPACQITTLARKL